MHSTDVEEVLGEPDPIKRGRMATELMAVYRLRIGQLAKIRREAVTEASVEYHMNYSMIAEALGLTKGRMSQIRSDET